MNDKISVIVPIYNVEKYLPTCLDSIINQTYKNLEIILINDGSKDSSLKICKEYADKDSRIKVINQKNKGVSCSRNVGLANVTGEYICFVDSDDCIKDNMFEKLYNYSKEYDADIAMCEFYLINEEDERIKYNLIKTNDNGLIDYDVFVKVLRNDKKFEILYKGSETGLAGIVIWNKIYKRKVFDGLKYRPNTIHEDEAMAHIILNRANRIVYTNEKLYMYRRRKNSITTGKYTVKRQEILKALKTRYEFFKKTKRNMLAAKALLNYEYFLIIHYKECMKHNLTKAKGKILVKEMRKMLPDIINIKGLSIFNRVLGFSFSIFPKFTIRFLLLCGRELNI